MSGRKYSYLFTLIVCVVFFLFSITTNEASSSLQEDVPEHLRPIIEEIKAGPGVDDPVEKKLRLALKIHKDYEDLQALFESDDTNKATKMAKILGKKATLVVGSQTYYGKQQIRDFWDGVPDNYQSVVFTLDSAIIVYEEMEEMEEYDHIAYEFFTFKLIEQREGKILKNQDGKGGRSCRHMYGCECRTR